MLDQEERLVSPEAIAQAQALGLEGDLNELLRTMYRYSTPFSTTNANRRYEGFMLDVTDTEIVSIQLLPKQPKAARHRKFREAEVRYNDRDKNGYKPLIDLTR